MTNTRAFEPQIDAYEPSLELAASSARRFAEKLADYSAPVASVSNPFHGALATPPCAGRWLTLAGLNGCGKTMLARQLYNHAKAINPFGGALWKKTDSNTSRRPNVVWIDEVEFSSRCKGGEYDLPEYLGEDWLVVLDDMGASRDTTGFVGDMIFRLCNARREGFTIFTTNLSHEQVATRIDPRVASRLIRDGNIAVRIKAGDYANRQRERSAA